MSKSYVTMEQHLCPVCGKSFDTGSILMDLRLREQFEMSTVSGWGLCPACQKLRDDGYVALVECKSPPGSPDNIQLQDANRTGRIAHVRVKAFKRIFNVPVPEEGLAFIEIGVIEKLQSLPVAPGPGPEPDTKGGT